MIEILETLQQREAERLRNDLHFIGQQLATITARLAGDLREYLRQELNSEQSTLQAHRRANVAR